MKYYYYHYYYYYCYYYHHYYYYYYYYRSEADTRMYYGAEGLLQRGVASLQEMYHWLLWRSAAQALGHMHGIQSSSDQITSIF